MVVYTNEPCAETKATPPQPGSPGRHAHDNIAFYESKNLRQWTRTGAFTDPDRIALYECPEMFELPVAGKPGESRWILLGAENRYFTGSIFTDRTFNEIYADEGVSYELRNARQNGFPSKETKLTAAEGTVVSSLKIFRLKSIWNEK